MKSKNIIITAKLVWSCLNDVDKGTIPCEGSEAEKMTRPHDKVRGPHQGDQPSVTVTEQHRNSNLHFDYDSI